MTQAYANTSGNKAEIFIPQDDRVIVKAKANSKFTQKVIMTSKSGVHRKVFRGSGEGDGDIGLFWIQVDSNELFTASFEFSTGGEQFRPSRLKDAGYYETGKERRLEIIAENGDGADLNDCILAFHWSV